MLGTKPCRLVVEPAVYCPMRHQPGGRRHASARVRGLRLGAPLSRCGIDRMARFAVSEPTHRCDLRQIFPGRSQAILERLIRRTAVSCDLDSRRSAQRFERDTYHGDALPTELRGRVLSCLTCGFTPPGGQLRSAQRRYSANRVTRFGRWRAYRTPAVATPSPGGVQPVPRTIHAYADDGALLAAFPATSRLFSCHRRLGPSDGCVRRSRGC